jgi:hypothetical protein
MRLLNKRCRILPAGGLGKVVHYKGSPEGNPSGGGLGVSPSFKKSPKIGGYRGLLKTTSTVSQRIDHSQVSDAYSFSEAFMK